MYLLTRFLTGERLKGFSDSVLLVAITILAYNLVPPSLINGQLNTTQVRDFLNNVYSMVSSFVVIFIFWIIFMKIVDYVDDPDDLVVMISITFFVLVLLIPVFTLAQFEYKSWQSIALLALLQIVSSSILITLWTYLVKHKRNLLNKDLTKTDNIYMYSTLAVIPSLYLVSLGIAFISIQFASIFPVVTIPAIILLNRGLNAEKKE
jgi:uncharacterized membrane protein